LNLRPALSSGKAAVKAITRAIPAIEGTMLQRVLEPEVMDTAEEARDYDAMDHAAVNRRFVADFLAVWDEQGPVLDAGTGTAQIPVVLCQSHPRATIVGIDAAEQMLAVARQNIHRAGFQDRIRVELVDAKGMPFADGSFGAVISNSIVHHIPGPAAVVAEMVRVVRSGGWLFVRDLLRPPDDAMVRRLVQEYAGNATAHQQKLFDDSLRAALTLEEVRLLITPLGFRPGSVQQTSDRHWTWTARKG
jgi:ubiquinone/menaquinone biosynthesis C-methylase UbiE